MSTPLTFGYLYDFRNPPQWARRPTDLYAEILDFAAWSETAGFAGAWVPEHHGAQDGYMPAPNVALAAIAARTSRIRLGSAIALAPLYHPVRFAEECAVLDILSDGRLEMALAIGYRRRETQAYGVDFGKRGARFDEFLAIVQRLWAGETVDFSGQHYNVTGATLRPAAPRGRIPSILAALPRRRWRGWRNMPTAISAMRKCAASMPTSCAPRARIRRARIRIQSLFTLVADDPEAAMAEMAPISIM
ncbi:LLM class flavin-dependent oxidoreductase [Sphingobium scionense]